jgi:signal transduction histidine kinase
MEDLSLHILDIAENSINAGATNIEICIKENTARDELMIEILDDGKGMSSEIVKKVTDPFYTTRITRSVGLGLALFDEAARMANGKLEIQSDVGTGTKINARFQLSHIDRKPIGNMAETIITLIAGRPDINITYKHERDSQKFVFSTAEIKSRLDDIEINSTEILSFIKNYLDQEENNVLQ